MKIAFLCGPSLNDFRKAVLEIILAASRHHPVCCFLDENSSVSRYEKLKWHLRRGRGGYIIIMLLKKIFLPKEKKYDTVDYFDRKNIKIIKISKPFDEENLAPMKEFSFDVLVYVGGFGRILRENILEIPPFGVLSYHHGNMRYYRGQPSFFWELYNGENEIGVTIQKLNIGLDKGAPVVEKFYNIEYGETLRSVSRRIYGASSGLMLSALDLLEKNVQLSNYIEKFGKLYTLPNMKEWIIFNVKITYRVIRRTIIYSMRYIYDRHN